MISFDNGICCFYCSMFSLPAEFSTCFCVVLIFLWQRQKPDFQDCRGFVKDKESWYENRNWELYSFLVDSLILQIGVATLCPRVCRLLCSDVYHSYLLPTVDTISPSQAEPENHCRTAGRPGPGMRGIHKSSIVIPALTTAALSQQPQTWHSIASRPRLPPGRPTSRNYNF